MNVIQSLVSPCTQIRKKNAPTTICMQCMYKRPASSCHVFDLYCYNIMFLVARNNSKIRQELIGGKAERYAEIERPLFGNTSTIVPECLPYDEKVQTRTLGFLFNIVCSVVLFFNLASRI
mmetsp:Transcript_15415/g.20710  ORF Transcript_15415/g.20710 Transcript_15415/m.20710 type:complete len:120 (+) Transcript_15415:687-1046(+)